MIGAKINGMIVPIERVPQNGEIVEILTSSASKGPSRDWLKIVKTGEARNKIRQWFKKEQRPENIVMGKAEIDRQFRHMGGGCNEQQKNQIVLSVANRIGIRTAEDLYNTIGYGGITISKLLPKLRDELERVIKTAHDEEPSDDVSRVQTVSVNNSHKRTSGIIVDGVEGCTVKLAKCCNPLPGDSLIGFITRGYGISIHKKDCPNVALSKAKAETADRWVSAYWDKMVVRIIPGICLSLPLLYAPEDRISLIADITAALAEMKVSIYQISSRNKSNGDVIISIVIGAKNLEHVKSIVSRLKSVRSVIDVTRGYNASR